MSKKPVTVQDVKDGPVLGPPELEIRVELKRHLKDGVWVARTESVYSPDFGTVTSIARARSSHRAMLNSLRAFLSAVEDETFGPRKVREFVPRTPSPKKKGTRRKG